MTNSHGTGERPSHTRTQHALRLLVLLDRTGETSAKGVPPGTIKAVRSELRLQALDFWMRNLDYLADEVISQVANGISRLSNWPLPEACSTTRSRICTTTPCPGGSTGHTRPSTTRWRCRRRTGSRRSGLATFRRSGCSGTKSHRNQLFLTTDGAAAVAAIATDPVLRWYPRQAELVALVAGDTVGSKLKDRQYEQATYAGTELGLDIAAIAEHVRKRDGLEATAGGSGGGM